MSAPAIKSSMPGVGTPTASNNHTMLPMNMVSQKVVPPSDQATGGIKPLPNPTNHSFVSMQTPGQPLGQPLSLIQEHKAPTHASPFSNNIATDQVQQLQQPQPLQQQPQQQHQQPQNQQHHSDPNKMMQNGMEQSKVYLIIFSIHSYNKQKLKNYIFSVIDYFCLNSEK